MSNLMLDVDQAGELKAAFRRGNWTNAQIKKLCEGDTLARVRHVVEGAAEIVPKKHIAEIVPVPEKHIIDCDADPFLPAGWSVEQHVKTGQMEWDPAKVALFLAEEQKIGSIKGDKLRELLAGKPVMNANVLDDLLANPHLIPEEWKSNLVFFWSTIYRNSGVFLCVRCLGWYGGRWYWSCRWLGHRWFGLGPAAVLAS